MSTPSTHSGTSEQLNYQQMLVIGLTGGIGSGKSKVADSFRSLGVPVIDADEISHDLTQIDTDGYIAVVREFGTGILARDNSLDRKKLRQMVFTDPRKRKILENLLHPIIRKEMRNRMSVIDAPYCILVIPLLLETGQQDLVDRVLVIDTPEEEQIRRVIDRDGTPLETIQGILEAQMDRESRLVHADDVLENSGDLEQLYSKVAQLNDRYIDMSASQSQRLHTSDPTVARATLDSSQAIPGQISISAMPWLGAQRIEHLNSGQLDFTPQPNECIYELPLNERLRTMMRLEGLFEEIDHHMQGNSVWDSRSAVKVIFAILNTLNRPDIKTDLIKEIERIFNVLNRYRAVEGVDVDRLSSYQRRLREVSHVLKNINGQIGLSVRQDELISTIKQRESIPGGPSTFDVPAYSYWLNQDMETRQKDIYRWLGAFNPLRTAIELILEIVRKSAMPVQQQAQNGTFQLILDSNVNYQLIRVILPTGSLYCAEISGGRHRFGIRFTQIKGTTRPVQTRDTVEFKLHTCAI